MKKKLLVLFMATTLTLSLAACGANSDPIPETNSVASSADSSVVSDQDTTQSTLESSIAENTSESNSDATMATMLYQAFLAATAENPDASAMDIANTANERANLEIGPMVMEIQPGFLTGFNNYTVEGFQSGAIIAPMIGSIPFVGYVFEMPADADVNDFVAALKENSDPSWNVCTTADETIVDVVGNKVFFVMGPTGEEY